MVLMKFSTALLIAIVCSATGALSPASATAAEKSNPAELGEGPVRISLSLSEQEIAPGDGFKALIKVAFEPGWRFKDGILEAKFDPVKGISKSEKTLPPATAKTKPAENASVFTYEFRAKPDVAPGKRAIKVQVKFQAVSDDFSAPPAAVSLKTDIEIAAPGARPPKPPAIPEGQVSAWHAWVTPASAAPGQKVALTVEAILAKDWHTYSITQPDGGPKATEIFVDDVKELSPLGPFKGSPFEKAHDPAFDMEVESYSDKARFTGEFAVAPDAAPQTLKISGAANAMFCDAINCMPPMDFPFLTELKIVPPPPKAPPAARKETPPVSQRAPEQDPPSARKETPASSQPVPRQEPPEEGEAKGIPAEPSPVLSDSETARSEGMLSFIFAAIVAGFGALLTPCVFPMIPITISFFTKNTGRSSAQSAGQALLYCVSIIVCFLILAILLSAFLGATGAATFAANPFVNLFIAALFIIFAFSLFGAFEIQIPTEWLNKVGLGNQGGGVLGIIGMGFVFTVTSFTCTVGFVGFILVLSAHGEWFWPIVGMLFFAASFSLPFFFLALFPQALSRLPKSGGWLNSVKVVMGLLEMAFALKFISNVDLYYGWGMFTRPLLLACWTAVAAAVGLYLLGLFRLANDGPSEGIGPTRLVLSLFFLTLALYLGSGLTGNKINSNIESYLPPPLETVSAELKWTRTTYSNAVQLAKEESKTLFIDFTGIYCNNCRLMEIDMFPKPEVQAELKRFTLAQIYTDDGTEESKDNQKTQVERFGSAALPLYVLIDPQTEETIAMFPGMTRDTGEFLEFLRSDVSGKKTN